MNELVEELWKWKILFVRLNTRGSIWIQLIFTENWKHCSKIIFKCVNSVMGSIFNEKVVEKWSLWVLWTVHGTHGCEMWWKVAEKSNISGYCSWTVAWIVKFVLLKCETKKKIKKKNANAKAKRNKCGSK